MTPSGSQGKPVDPKIQVQTDALRAQAGAWDGKAKEFGDLSAKVKSLEFTRWEAGLLFQGFVTPYANLVETVTSLTTQAQKASTDIGRALRAAADTYDDEDRRQVRKVKGFDAKLKDSK